MLGVTRWHVFKVLAAILCIAGLTWLGMAYLIPGAAVADHNRDVAER